MCIRDRFQSLRSLVRSVALLLEEAAYLPQGRRVGSIGGDHKHPHPLSQSRIRNGDDPGLRHLGMGLHRVLHLGRADIRASPDDYVLLAVVEAQVALVLNEEKVSGPEEAVLCEGGFVQVRAVEVAREDVRALVDELSYGCLLYTSDAADDLTRVDLC